MKAMVRRVAAGAAGRLGLLTALERSARGSVTILCYHRVLPEDRRRAYHDPGLVVTPETFRAHCKVLAARYQVMTLGSAFPPESLMRRREKPIAVITFDDGYRDNLAYAAPILREAGLPATFFIVAGLVNGSELPWYDVAGAALQAMERAGQRTNAVPVKQALAQAKQMSPTERRAWVDRLVNDRGLPKPRDEDLIMTSGHLRELASAEHEIGSHTMTHPILPQCSDSELQVELSASRTKLAEIVGQRIDTLAYPNGDWDERVAQAAESAGYRLAVSVAPGVNRPADGSPFDLKRWFIDQERLSGRAGGVSESLFRTRICGLA